MSTRFGLRKAVLLGLMVAIFGMLSIGSIAEAKATSNDSVQAVATEVLAFGLLESTPFQMQANLEKRVRTLFEGSVWTFFADGTLTLKPGRQANMAFDKLVGTWRLDDDDRITFSVGYSSTVGNTGSTQVTADGILGETKDGQLAAYVIYQASSATSAVIYGKPYGTNTFRSYEFVVALG